MYEVGRQLLERGHPDKARRYFRGAIKKDRTFLPAYIGIGEILVREGKTKNAVEILKKIYAKTRSDIILHRLEELFLELGEPDEIIRAYHEALQQDPHNTVIQFYSGSSTIGLKWSMKPTTCSRPRRNAGAARRLP